MPTDNETYEASPAAVPETESLALTEQERLERALSSIDDRIAAKRHERDRINAQVKQDRDQLNEQIKALLREQKVLSAGYRAMTRAAAGSDDS